MLYVICISFKVFFDESLRFCKNDKFYVVIFVIFFKIFKFMVIGNNKGLSLVFLDLVRLGFKCSD